MPAITTNGSSLLTEGQSHSQPVGADKEFITGLIYGDLNTHHLKLRALNKDGNQRPEQALRNEQSAIDDWIAHWKLSPSQPVGEELGVRFVECLLQYLTACESRELARQTVLDRKSIITKLRESFLELWRTGGLPDDFVGALMELVKKAGTSVHQLSRKVGMPTATLYHWINRTRIPNPKAIKHVRKLERVLEVPPGTLSSRLPGAHLSWQSRRRCTTAWREHQRILCRLKYRLPELTGQPGEEWDELVLFFTELGWADARGLATNSEWRIRWNTNRCPTAELNCGFVRGFFGFLCLPETAPDKRIAGLGFDPKDLTLALLTDADLVLKFLDFMKVRSVSGSFNEATLKFLNFCMMLARNETGYLRQRLGFGAKLPRPVAENDWPEWCESNRLKMLKFQKKITKSNKGDKGRRGKNDRQDRVRMTRNPFEPVMDIITERQHPITALFDLADRLESLTPWMERGSKSMLAVHSRSIFQVRLIGSNPLRCENFSMMTYTPQDQDSFEQARELFRRYRKEKRTLDVSKLYVKTTKGSNLYQKPDGSWWLRFNERDFKNDRGEDYEPGVRNAPYEVPVVPSVWGALNEYLFRHRPFLNESLVSTLREERARRGLPILSADDVLAVMRCHYVFRPEHRGVRHVGSEQLLAGYGTGQMSARTLSGNIFSLTSRYLPESKGFCAHACRHLVATEYIKNHPEGWEEAAVALHNTAAMVRKHYSWVSLSDRIKPWNDHHERLKEMHDRGEI